MYQFKFIQAFGLKDIIIRSGTTGNNMDFIMGSYFAGKEPIFPDEEGRSCFNLSS